MRPLAKLRNYDPAKLHHCALSVGASSTSPPACLGRCGQVAPDTVGMLVHAPHGGCHRISALAERSA
jgi:hypothetical protein